MHSINAKSTKDEIITAAVELTDHQAETIDRLLQQSRILWAALALSLAWQILF